MIYNSPSIYKQGGGGGGYKDGGQLTPAQYITVPNNVIATYDNSADEINFIIEDDGKPHNSIVQVSTSVNATVNVYEIRNGFYYLLGVVGTNTINAGDDYTVNIVGNSYVVENVTQQSSEPAAVEIAGGIYGLKKIGSLYWTTSNLKDDSYQYIWEGECYYTYHAPINGWRIPNEAECDDLMAAYPNTADVKSTTEWVGGGGNGNNSSGLNFYPKGYWNPYQNRPSNLGYASVILRNKNGNILTLTITSNYMKSGSDPAPIRLVHEV